MVDAKALPPVAAVYHFKAVPDADRLATLAELQNAWAVAVGTAVTFTVTITVALELSHEFKV